MSLSLRLSRCVSTVILIVLATDVLAHQINAIEIVFGGEHGLDFVDPLTVHHAHVGRNVFAIPDADARSDNGRLLVGTDRFGAGAVLDVGPHASQFNPFIYRLASLVLLTAAVLDRDEAVERAGSHIRPSRGARAPDRESSSRRSESRRPSPATSSRDSRPDDRGSAAPRRARHRAWCCARHSRRCTR